MAPHPTYTGIHTCEMPAPTRDISQAAQDLRDAGICVIPEVIGGETLRKLRDAAYAAAEDDRDYGRLAPLPTDDEHTQRVWGLMSRSPRFGELIEHPLALELVRSLLGWPALLSNYSANILSPGAGSMPLHADQSFSLEPWQSAEDMNIAWCVDDYTAENSATEIVPGSHLNGGKVRPEDRSYPTQPIIAPVGSLIAIDGRIWHKNGVNRSENTRCTLFAVYTLPVLACTENWTLSLNPMTRQYASETMQTLLGFRPTTRMRVNSVSWIDPAARSRTAAPPGPYEAT